MGGWALRFNRLAEGCANGACPLLPAIIVIFILVLTDQLRILNKLLQGHLKCHQAEALLHVPDEWCRKLIAESNLSKDVRSVCLDSHVLVYHSDLLGIKREFALVDLNAAPEILHFFLNGRTDLCDAVHFLKRCCLNLGMALRAHQVELVNAF